MVEDEEPELADSQPHERPLRGPRTRLLLRIAVVLGLLALVLPGILVTLSTANRTAARTCATYAAFYAPEAQESVTRFEFAGGAGLGWTCYAVMFDGREILLASLGLIPGGATLPSGPVERS